MNIIICFLLLLISSYDCIFNLNFEPCPPKHDHSIIAESRKLHVITCETKGSHRVGWMKNDTLLIWNATGIPLRQQGLMMSNPCQGVNWKLHGNGLLTKPMTYHSYVTKLLADEPDDNARNKLYIILMDSDTFWGVNGIHDIWNRFDCVRKDKDMIVSTEMGCWMGYHCTKDDINLWYPNIKDLNTYSPFVNSGVIMGKALVILDMLSYILAHNTSYLTLNTKKKIPVLQFHDQHAVADYSLRVMPHLVMKDYHQQFAGGLGVQLPNGPKDSPVACKTLSGDIDYHCREVSVEFSVRFPRYYRLNESTCETTRLLRKHHLGHQQLQFIASHPVIWHGNGKAKKVFLAVGGAAYVCQLRKAYPYLNITIPQFNASSRD